MLGISINKNLRICFNDYHLLHTTVLVVIEIFHELIIDIHFWRYHPPLGLCLNLIQFIFNERIRLYTKIDRRMHLLFEVPSTFLAIELLCSYLNNYYNAVLQYHRKATLHLLRTSLWVMSPVWYHLQYLESTYNSEKSYWILVPLYTTVQTKSLPG